MTDLTPTPTTPFVETEALLALMNDDDTRAELILRDMLPGELNSLRHHARYLAEMCGSALRIKQRERIERNEGDPR